MDNLFIQFSWLFASCQTVLKDRDHTAYHTHCKPFKTWKTQIHTHTHTAWLFVRGESVKDCWAIRKHFCFFFCCVRSSCVHPVPDHCAVLCRTYGVVEKRKRIWTLSDYCFSTHITTRRSRRGAERFLWSAFRERFFSSQFSSLPSLVEAYWWLSYVFPSSLPFGQAKAVVVTAALYPDARAYRLMERIIMEMNY